MVPISNSALLNVHVISVVVLVVISSSSSRSSSIFIIISLLLLLSIFFIINIFIITFTFTGKYNVDHSNFIFNFKYVCFGLKCTVPYNDFC